MSRSDQMRLLAGCVLLLPLLVGCATHETHVLSPIFPESFIDKHDLKSLVPPRMSLVTGASSPHSKTRPRAQGEPASKDGERVLDLATALSVGGASSLQVDLARAELSDAHARMEQANALWLPDLSAGLGFDRHKGNDQSTDGRILDTSTNSGFAGSGLFASFNLADALIEPDSAQHDLDAASAHVVATVNDALLTIARAYNDLVEAQSKLSLAKENVSLSEKLVDLTESFAHAGQGLESDAARARSERAYRKKVVAAARQRVRMQSVRLATVLRLDPTQHIRAKDEQLIPFTLIAEGIDLPILIKEAMLARPEIHSLTASYQAHTAREDQETVRPFIPRLVFGLEAGGMGGGKGSDFNNFDGTSQVSVGLVWTIRNLGLGEASARKHRAAQSRIAKIRVMVARNQISKQVTLAYVRSAEGRHQVELSLQNIKEALESLDLNLKRIHGAEGLPIEALQAFRAAAKARTAYIESVAGFNRAQFDLLRAVGRPVKR